MILAFDTSSAACTAALFDDARVCIARRDEVIGRGHSERLVPMIAELLDGRKAQRVLVGVGPGSFTGIRVGIAAAHGLSIGWDAEISGMSSLALLAAGVEDHRNIATAIIGGHGELFVQEFTPAIEPIGSVASLRPEAAASVTEAPTVAGSGAEQLVAARGWGEAIAALPSASNALLLPPNLGSLAAKPVYARAPDARVREAA